MARAQAFPRVQGKSPLGLDINGTHVTDWIAAIDPCDLSL
jgi:hypothetical protein